MANSYYYRVSGLEPLEVYVVEANTRREADFKVKTTSYGFDNKPLEYEFLFMISENKEEVVFAKEEGEE